MGTGSRQTQAREYVHQAPKSDHYLKTKKAITLVRTDHKALTLDKFLNQDSQKFNINPSLAQDGIQNVLPVNLISVKKLINNFTIDTDN